MTWKNWKGLTVSEVDLRSAKLGNFLEIFLNLGKGWQSAIFLEGTRFAKALGFFHELHATIKGSVIIRHSL
jgi:hypothetical protein